jgi:hypothetical protein|tara:strand:- start:731 stop:1099 length:369 start_codon:yes stop_codon:yes gene_type:complete
MKKVFAIISASLMFVYACTLSTPVYAVKESKLATAYSATLWGAGIGIVTGLGLAALSTENDESSLVTENRIRVNVLQGFGTGIIFGLVYGLFEISGFSNSTDVTTSFNPLSDQVLVSYNIKF